LINNLLLPSLFLCALQRCHQRCVAEFRAFGGYLEAGPDLFALLLYLFGSSILPQPSEQPGDQNMPSSSRSDSLKNQKLDNDSFVAFDHAAAGQ
jgi:hypothetical protein